jgi:hypothetical protein
MKPKIDFNKSQIRWASVAVLIILSLLAGGFAGHFLTPAQPAMAQHVERVWADVNSDGLIDLIVEGSVIFQSPLQPTPTPTVQP